MRDTLIFDLDGTLLDTLGDLTDSVNRTLASFGFPERSHEEIRCFVGNGVKVLLDRALPAGTSPETAALCLRYFREEYAQHCQDKTAPYRGIPELLAALKTAGYRLAVVSNKFDAAVKALIPYYFGEIADAVIGEREGIRKKPAPDMVEEALRQLGSVKECAVYIGDSEVDVQTAEAVGLPCLSVLWGFRTREELEMAGASHFAESPEAIPSLLETLD